MAQPTGATPLNSTWTGKGLKAGLYITESGAFVFDSGGTSTAATGGGWVTDASNTDPSGPNGDIIVTPVTTGSSPRGALYSGAASTSFLSAFADNFTFIVDFRPPTTGSGYESAKFFGCGSGSAGGVMLDGGYVDASNGFLRLTVYEGAYGATRSATINIPNTGVSRVAFKYQRGNPIGVFVGGSSVTPTSAVNDYSGATNNPSIVRALFDSGAYSIVPSGSHLLIFDAALSNADISALATDVWQVFGTGGGGGNASPTFPGPNIGNQTGTVGTALTSNNIASKFSDTDALTFSAVGSWPPGVTVSSGGVISGTPTIAGTYGSLKVRATDTAAQTVDSDTFSFTISAAVSAGSGAGSVSSLSLSAPAATATGTSAGSGTITTPVLKNNTGTVIASISGWAVNVYNQSTGALVVQKTGLSTNASGIITITDAAIMAGTTYTYEPVHATYGRRLPTGTAS